MRINIDIDHSSVEEIDKAIEFLENLKSNTTKQSTEPIVGGIFDMPLAVNTESTKSEVEIKVPERKSSPIIGFNEIYNSLKDERKKKDNTDVRVETY